MGKFFIMAVTAALLMHIVVCGAFFYCFPKLGGKWTAVAAAVILSGVFFALFMTRSMLSYYWLGSVFILFCAALITLLLTYVLGRGCAGAAGAALGVIAVAAAIITAHMAPVVKRIDISAQNLPVEKLTIAQISDTHFGAGVSVTRAQKLAAQINALKPDIIVITGDFNENGGAEYSAAISAMKAKYGVYGSLGNHEFYRGTAKNTAFYERSNVTLLRQQSAEPAPGVQVLGIDDLTAGRITSSKLKEILGQNLDKDKFSIVLEHEPEQYEIFAAAGANLVLSGHTHSGQIFPFSLLVRLRYPHYYGLTKMNNTYFYVTSGTFYWGPPMRLFTRNEIAFFTITK